MDSKTFILRKRFLEEFYKERVNFTFERDMIKNQEEDYTDRLLTYETNVFYPETFNLGFIKRIIPFIYYLNSLYGCNLSDDVIINGFNTEIFFIDDGLIKHTFFSLFLFERNISYLTYLNQEVDKYEENKIRKIPFVPFNVRVDFFISVRTNLNKIPINLIKTFKTGDCVICLSKPPQILYCNCGHICVCTQCNKRKILKTCPICKTENTILRVIE